MTKGDSKVPLLTRIISPFVALLTTKEFVEQLFGVTIVLKFPPTGETSNKQFAVTNVSIDKVDTAFFMSFTVLLGLFCG
jgi:hypothetical protein